MPLDKIILNERVIVLITIPLTEKRYNRDMKDIFGNFYFGRPKEFIKNESLRLGRSWEKYFNEIASFILFDVKEIIGNTNCTVDFDVTYKKFINAIKSDDYDVIYLFAHHIMETKSSKSSLIEFADGGMSTEKVIRSIEKLKNKQKSLFFFVCESDEFEKLQRKKPKFQSLVGSTSWNLPTVLGFNFIKYWVLELNNKRGLLDAYSRAISKFLK